MAYNIGNTTVITNNAALGSVDGNSLNLANNANIASGGNSLEAEVLMVGGGGSGARSGRVGGGGAGGLFRGAVSLPLSTGITVTIGAGGASRNSSGNGYNGSESKFGDLFVAARGRAGNQNGGGGDSGYPAGQGAIHSGNSGAGTDWVSGAGSDSNGGNGFNNNFGGWNGGGGGAGVRTSASPGNNSGGSTGGGNGGYFASANPGTANTGGGGGGSDGGGNRAGGSGVCIVRYVGNTANASGGTTTVTGGYVYHRFNSSGTFNTGS